MKRRRIPRCFATILAVAALCALPPTACSQPPRPDYLLTDSDEALANWHNARYFQAQARYELAREHYQLALAAARTPYVREALGRELNAVDLQIKALR